MDLRADALAAAVEVLLAAEGIARDPRHRGTRATVGSLDIAKGVEVLDHSMLRLDDFLFSLQSESAATRGADAR